ncbi:ABC transporter substrate-binding protein [Caviibacter abscessus]|uniref:ABC transporter substrate-binding protein n=1 Tax=Caviibacter abscessus TaxID=1766719 RepID=UPI000832DD9B|nr:ABC transporter substrate-binding protein [Caviibacter abscessus]
MKYFLTLFSTLFLFLSCGINQSNSSINTAMTTDIDSINPYKLVSSNSKQIMYNVYEGLVMPDENGDVVPAIAKSYSVSNDGLTYEFVIRNDVYFHNGEKLVLDDVLFSLKKVKELKFQEAFENIKSIEAKDENTLLIHLNEPDSSFIYYLTTAIVSKKTFYSIDTKENGTGAYKIKTYKNEQKLVLEKFDKYYGQKANINTININISPNSQTNFLKLLSGEYNFLTTIDVKREKELKNFTVIKQVQNMVFMMGINNEKVPKNERLGLATYINKDDIIAKTSNNNSVKIYSSMSPILKKYYNDNITEIGIHGESIMGKTYTLKIPTNDKIYIETAQIIKSQFEKMSVKIKIVEMEFSAWLKEVYTNRDFELTLIGLSGKLDPNSILRRYTSTYKRNFINFNNKEYDKLISEAKKTADDNKKVENYKKAQQILVSEGSSVYIMDPAFIVAHSKNISGYTQYAIPYINFAKLKFGEN